MANYFKKLLKTAAVWLPLTLVCAWSTAFANDKQPLNSLFVGVVYNIFHEEFSSDEEFFRQASKDIAAMKAANMTHILLFPMSQWDPQTKKLDWKRTDYLIRKIEEADLKFVPLLLKEQQASHYFPIWAYKETGLWAEHYRPGEERNAREDVDFNDPRVYPYLERYFKAVAERYGKSPALAFYNIWNEPHYTHMNDGTEAAFRVWLKRKYGDLSALRRSWGEDYSDWDQVTPFLNDDWNSSMPRIDWILFHNDYMSELLGKLKSTLQKYDSQHAINANPVNSNWSLFSQFDKFATDNWVFTEHNDINGLSYYPDVWDRANPHQEHPLWMHNLTLNTVRSASGSKDYILSEMYTNAKTGLTLAGYLDAAEINRTTWAAFANNAKGIIFWKWEPFMRGRQSLGRGLVGLDGELAPRGQAVKTLAGVINQHQDVLYRAQPRPAEVAVLFDMVGLLKNLEEPTDPRSINITYQSNAGLFKALDEANISVDMLRTDRGITARQLAQYKIVFLPFQLVMRADIARLLTDYVRNGGHLVADARTATLDELDFAYRKNPGGLTKVFGAERKDWIASPGYFAAQGDGIGRFEGRHFKESLTLSPTAKVLARFDDESPALVQNAFGRGVATLAATTLGASYFERADAGTNNVILSLTKQAGVKASARTKAPALSIKVHQTDNTLVVYVLNASAQPVTERIELDTGNLKITAWNDITQGKTITSKSLTPSTQALQIELPARGVGVYISR